MIIITVGEVKSSIVATILREKTMCSYIQKSQLDAIVFENHFENSCLKKEKAVTYSEQVTSVETVVAKGGTNLENLARYRQLFKEGKYTKLFDELKKTTAAPKMGKTAPRRNIADLEAEYRALQNIKQGDPIPYS